MTTLTRCQRSVGIVIDYADTVGEADGRVHAGETDGRVQAGEADGRVQKRIRLFPPSTRRAFSSSLTQPGIKRNSS